MAHVYSRPEGLPDFRSPPLNEVVLGVQFAPAQGYQQVRAGDVWALFRADYPTCQELPPLAPVFETFGPASSPPALSFGLISGAQHDRFWFLSKNEEELLQFQQDRFLHNWRKNPDGTNEYPRFESMIVKFEKEISDLERYFNTLRTQSLVCNQAELSYINHIHLTGNGNPNKVADWLRFVDFGTEEPENFSCVFRRAIRGSDGAPTGRLICEVGAGATLQGQNVLGFTLTVRGPPSGTGIEASIEFLRSSRKVIVKAFAELTTDSAHRIWERVQ